MTGTGSAELQERTRYPWPVVYHVHTPEPKGFTPKTDCELSLASGQYLGCSPLPSPILPPAPRDRQPC